LSFDGLSFNRSLFDRLRWYWFNVDFQKCHP
jgi:hypothetical protein